MNGNHRDRARRLVDGASHDSVTTDLLLGEGRFSNEFYLYDRPAVAHLDDGEQPHYAFTNELKGIGVGSKRNTRTPDEGGATVILVTDRRVLALLGRRDGDERLAIPYSLVTGAEYSTGLMKHRIAVETVDDTYHLWIDSGSDEPALSGAAELIRERATGGEGPASGGAGTHSDAAASDGGATGGQGGSGGVGTGSTRDAPGSTRDAPGSTGAASGSVTGGAGSPGNGGSGSVDDAEDDPLDKLERLQELNERGVITDEEFERKKAELLDQI